MDLRVIDMTIDRRDLVDAAATLLHDAFKGRTRDWQDLESARGEALESLTAERVSRVAVDESGTVVGWIGAMPTYGGIVWEIHPLVVKAPDRRRGVGRALVRDVEEIVRRKGAVTLCAASDDENRQTTLSGVD